MKVGAMIQGWCPWCGDHMGWGMGGMWLFWLLVLIALIAVAWKMAGRGAGRSSAGEDRAEATLRERYARGEIDEPTFRRMLDELRRK